jgi:hypothetical protein
MVGLVGVETTAHALKGALLYQMSYELTILLYPRHRPSLLPPISKPLASIIVRRHLWLFRTSEISEIILSSFCTSAYCNRLEAAPGIIVELAAES